MAAIRVGRFREWMACVAIRATNAAAAGRMQAGHCRIAAAIWPAAMIVHDGTCVVHGAPRLAGADPRLRPGVMTSPKHTQGGVTETWVVPAPFKIRKFALSARSKRGNRNQKELWPDSREPEGQQSLLGSCDPLAASMRTVPPLNGNSQLHPETLNPTYTYR